MSLVDHVESTNCSGQKGSQEIFKLSSYSKQGQHSIQTVLSKAWKIFEDRPFVTPLDSLF